MSKTIVYVAASSNELARAKGFAARLRMRGLTPSCDWIAVVHGAGEGNPDDYSVRRTAACEAVKAIDGADALALLVPHAPRISHGAFFELGYAEARGKLCVCVGETKRSVFCSLYSEVESEEQAIEIFVKCFPRRANECPHCSVDGVAGEIVTADDRRRYICAMGHEWAMQ
jgi:nucleoside 2-deoxyribosyltransferase